MPDKLAWISFPHWADGVNTSLTLSGENLGEHRDSARHQDWRLDSSFGESARLRKILAIFVFGMCISSNVIA